jgi:superfamily II DNA/RNA helicase
MSTTTTVAMPAGRTTAGGAPTWAVQPYAPVAPNGTDAPTFAALGLPAALVRALATAGLPAPFPIQAATIPDALAGHDLLARASTGSGKTLAFGLPLLARVGALPATPHRPHGLVLVPTRELAMQVSDTLEPLGRSLGLRLKTVAGGLAMYKQVDALRRGVDVLVATPGRLADLIRQGVCTLADVEVVVVDEADQMADMGFLPEVRALLSDCPKTVQTLLFSATLDGDVDELVRHHMHEPVRHELEPVTSPVDTMEHHLFIVNREDKHHMFSQIAARDGRTIMFVRSQLGAERVAGTIAAGGVRVLALHGGMTQAARTRAMSDFRSGRVPVLVATDVAARGIHVDDVSLVVHVDPPEDSKAYLHRAGRTARAGARGRVVTLALRNQARSMERLHERAGVTATKQRVELLDAHVVATTGAKPVHLDPARLPARTPDNRSGRSGRGDHRPPARKH